MHPNKEIIFKEIENKTVTWFPKTNQYLVLESITAKIINDLLVGISIKEIASQLLFTLDIPLEQAINFVSDIKNNIVIPNTKKLEEKNTALKGYKAPTVYQKTTYYKINGLVFKIDFQSEHEAYWVHPKLAHLTIEKPAKFNFHYQIFTQNKHTHLIIDGEYIGGWNIKDIHFFQGKFSMYIVQNMHQKAEKKWLGIFHASAVSNGKKAMLFLGDSGNGKSTSLALLQANGFQCLADDFVPVDEDKQEIFSFPAAISIKKNSVATLLEDYPELAEIPEFHLKELNKIVRYLPPNNKDYTTHLPCKALVFIKYKKRSQTVLNSIAKLEAFQKLVPDSWLSPIPKNAITFLNWFESLPCYELTYSKNNEMIAEVAKLFSDDL